MNKKMTLTIKSKSEILFIHLDNILYIQADGNYCNICLTDGSVINSLSYQRAEIARMMDEQLPTEIRKQFIMLGRSYLINSDYVLRIQPGKHLLTFCVNEYGTCKKIAINATSKALKTLIEGMK